MPSKPKPDLKQIIDSLMTAKKILPQLPVSDVARVMEAAQELLEACSAEFSKGTEALQKASDALTKQLNTIKNINPKVLGPVNNQDLRGVHPYQPANTYQPTNTYPPYTPTTSAPMQMGDPNTPMADGQIKLDIPIIQHLNEFAGDDFTPHQFQSFGEPSFNGEGPVSSPEVPEVANQLPPAFLPTIDAPED